MGEGEYVAKIWVDIGRKGGGAGAGAECVARPHSSTSCPVLTPPLTPHTPLALLMPLTLLIISLSVHDLGTFLFLCFLRLRLLCLRLLRLLRLLHALSSSTLTQGLRVHGLDLSRGMCRAL